MSKNENGHYVATLSIEVAQSVLNSIIDASLMILQADTEFGEISSEYNALTLAIEDIKALSFTYIDKSKTKKLS